MSRIVCIATLATAGCAPANSSFAPLPVDPCDAPMVDTTGWQEARGSAFTFRIPPDFERVETRPIDSEVQEWGTGPSRAVSYDYGWYSTDLKQASTQLDGFRSCTTRIADRQAFVVAGWDTAGTWNDGGPKLVVAASWRDVAPGAMQPTHLSISATSPRLDEYGMLVTILRSVRFEAR